MPPNPTVSPLQSAKESIKQSSFEHLIEAVSAADQEAELQSLSEIIKYDKFFIIVDATHQRITQAQGIAQWLGYDEATFTFEKYLQIIHPGFLLPLMHLAKVATEMATDKNFKVGFRQQQYIVNIALRHAQGHFVLCKRSLSAWQWQYDQTQQSVTHYCNEFTIINHHIATQDISPEAMPQILDKQCHKLADLENLFREKVSQSIEGSHQLFTPQEYRILRKIAYNPAMTAPQIAQSFKTQPSTIRTLNQRIIEKARLHFGDESIGTAKDVAVLLRRNYLV